MLLFLSVDIPLENLPWAPSLLPLYCRTINTGETQQQQQQQQQQNRRHEYNKNVSNQLKAQRKKSESKAK